MKLVIGKYECYTRLYGNDPEAHFILSPRDLLGYERGPINKIFMLDCSRNNPYHLNFKSLALSRGWEIEYVKC